MAQRLRMCRVCRAKRPKAELVRWVDSKAGWVRDDAQTMAGRGFYTDSVACAEKLAKMKVKR